MVKKQFIDLTVIANIFPEVFNITMENNVFITL